MRKSLEDIAFMIVHRKKYPNLPEELIPYSVYLLDSGHSIMCIPECLRADAVSNPDNYEVPVQTKYVLTHPYTIENGYIYIDAPYDPEYGLTVPEEYDEY